MTQQKSIAISLRTLCSNPESQSLILRESSCLNGLLALINSDQDIEALIISLQALLFLAQHPANRAILTKQPGLLIRLVKLTEENSSCNNKELEAQVISVAQQIIENLQTYINQEENTTKNNSQSIQQNNKSVNINSAGGSISNNNSTKQNNLGSNNSSGNAYKSRYLFTIQLEISGLTSSSDRDELEKQLIQQRGIVSVSYNKAGLCSVYSKLQPQQSYINNLIQTIQTINSNYRVVYKPSNSSSPEENTENAENESSKANLNVSSINNAQLPIKPVISPVYYPVASVSKALTAHSSYESSSLASRFSARQKKVEKQEIQQGAVKSLLTSVSSYFW